MDKSWIARVQFPESITYPGSRPDLRPLRRNPVIVKALGGRPVRMSVVTPVKQVTEIRIL